MLLMVVICCDCIIYSVFFLTDSWLARLLRPCACWSMLSRFELGEVEPDFKCVIGDADPLPLLKSLTDLRYSLVDGFALMADYLRVFMFWCGVLFPVESLMFIFEDC